MRVRPRYRGSKASASGTFPQAPRDRFPGSGARTLSPAVDLRLLKAKAQTGTQPAADRWRERRQAGNDMGTATATTSPLSTALKTEGAIQSLPAARNRMIA